MFAGFPPEALGWFRGLEADNSRAWFDAHRATYEAAVRDPLRALLDELAGELGGTVKVARQHRDLRFSADRTPYKTRAYGWIGVRPAPPRRLYADLSARGFFAGAGAYGFDRDQLARYRAAVLDDAAGTELTDLVAALDLEVFGEALRTVPRGAPRDHPRAALLRHKALFAGARIDLAGGITRDTALDQARAAWKACGPLAAWLEAHVGAG